MPEVSGALLAHCGHLATSGGDFETIWLLPLGAGGDGADTEWVDAWVAPWDAA